jgi:prepilin-type N-terminal cleavage/methylation domain-containing protein
MRRDDESRPFFYTTKRAEGYVLSRRQSVISGMHGRQDRLNRMVIHRKNLFIALEREGGFTLIELAMVLVIIGLLVGMGAGLMGPLTKKVKLSRTRDTVRDAYNAIIGYASANKTIPPDLQVLGIRTKDAYGRDLLYSAASGITAGNFCTTKGGYLKVNDDGTMKQNVSFIIFSQGENVCNDTGTASPFSISAFGTSGSCPSGYDDIVMYQDINFLRERACNPFKIVTDSLPRGTEEVAYPTVILQATDGTVPYLWSFVSGSLPSGINPPGPSGLLSGTPVEDGTFSFSVSVADQEGRTAVKSFSMTINPNDPEINTDVLHSGKVGIPYKASIAASGGSGPGTYSWNITGVLPPNLLSSGNVISGTPVAAGTYSFNIRITDGAGRTAMKVLSIAINN